ncbi:hypothetical protein Tco_1289305, partial [Tanacetum coccineum]
MRPMLPIYRGLVKRGEEEKVYEQGLVFIEERGVGNSKLGCGRIWREKRFGTYVDLVDPKGDLLVVEKEDAAQKQPEKAKRKKLLKQSDPLPAKRSRIDHPSLASGTGGKSLASLRRTLPEGSLILGSSLTDVHTHVTVQ